MLSQISNGFAEHVESYIAALPFAVTLVVLLGIGYIHHYRETH